MSTETLSNQTQSAETSNLPEYMVKMRHGQGKNAFYERIGAAWENKDGSIYIKLHGTQIIEKGFTLYAFDRTEQD